METKTTSKSQVPSTDLHCVNTHTNNSKFNSNHKSMFMKKLTTLLAVFFYLNSNAQVITTVVGTGVAGYSGDGGQATAALLNNPTNVVSDAAGNLYIADWSNNVVRKVNPLGIISTYAGNASAGFSGDGGPATAAQLFQPEGVALDASGNLYIADRVNNVIRMVNSAGIISTIAGTPHSAGNGGDGGPAMSAQLVGPTSVAVDVFGNIIIGDADNNTVRRISTAGIISTIAGTGTQGYAGDGGQATAAFLNQPYGVGADMAGNVYIADFGNAVIRKVNYSTGVISTIAGNGTSGYSGDGGQATTASLYGSSGVAIDAMGNLFIADDGNHVVRLVNTTGVIITYAGNGTAGYSGDGGPATSAQLNYDFDVWVDGNDNLFIADFGNNVIRKISQNIQSGQSLIGSPSIVGAGQDIVLFAGGTNRFEAQPGAISYLWSPTTGLSNDTISNPFVTVDTTTTYTVRIQTSSGTNYYTVRAVVIPPAPSSAASCANWVPNGDFETHAGCTHDISNLSFQTNWWNAGGSCDFYTACNTAESGNAWTGIPWSINYVEYPTNCMGNQNSSQYGNSYAGLIDAAFSSQYPNFEYTQTQLACPLITGQDYKLSFDASWATQSNFFCGNIGMYVSTNAVSASPNGSQIVATPQVDGTCGATSTWTTFTNTYTGAGEQYVTIGNFDVNAASQGVCARYNTNTLAEPPFTIANPPEDFTYDYLDNVIITPIPPTVFVEHNGGTYCAGTPTTFTFGETGSPANLCTWTGPFGYTATGQTAVGTAPLNAGTYTYTLTVNLGAQCSICSDLTSTLSITVLPTVSGGPNLTVTVTPNLTCVDPNTNLGGVSFHATGGGNVPGSYIWNPNTTVYFNASHSYAHANLPAGVYTASVTIASASAGTCSGAGTATFTILPAPVFTVTSSNDPICINRTSTTLTASDPNLTYSWTPATNLSATTGASVIANPTVTTTYQVVGTNTVTQCTKTESIQVRVISPPNLIVASTTICAGNVATLNLNSGNYSHDFTIYSPSQIDAFPNTSGMLTYTTAPTTTTVYTITSGNSLFPNVCLTTKTVTVTVIPLPITGVIASPTVICAGQVVTFTALGTATTYYWSQNSTHTYTAVAAPSGPTTYTVRGTVPFGCTNSATITINPLPLPTITVTAAPAVVCTGGSTTLTANSASATNYTWTPISTLNTNMGNPVVATPTSSPTTYTVKGTDANGCIGEATQNITIVPFPNVSITSPTHTMCAGATATLTAHSTGAGAATSYSWTPDLGLGSVTTGSVVTVTPSVTTVYTVTGTSAAGCSSQATFTLNITPAPTITITPSSNPVCVGTAVTLTACCASNYSWTANYIIATNPHAAVITTGVFGGAGIENYYVHGTQNGCSGYSTITLTVVPSPTVSISVSSTGNCSSSATNTICAGDAVTLNANSSTAISYSWNPGSLSSAAITVTPTVSTTYTVNVSDGVCSSVTATTNIHVINCNAGMAHLPLRGTTTSGTTYVVTTPLTLTGNLTINGSIVNMDANVSITVPTNITLTITNSHLKAVSNTMWQGIIVQGGGTVVVNQNSMIEDAVVAIDNGGQSNAVSINSPSNIRVNGAIFNCNRTAIRNAFYESSTLSNYNNNSFSVVDAVVTCRCGISQSGGTSTLTSYSGGGSLVSPTINDFYSVANFTSSTLKYPYTGQPAFEGVHLESDGRQVSQSPQNFIYPIGGGQLVLFDNLTYGINAINATFKVSNAAFQSPDLAGNGGPFNLPTVGGYGINAINNNPDWYNGIYVSNNQFIGMVRGINNVNYFDIDINTNTLFSQQVVNSNSGTPLVPPAGDYGMFIKTVRFIKANASNNNIANINNCIDFVIDKSLGYNGGNGEYVGPLTFTANTFADQFSTTNYNNRYIGNAIVVDNVITPPTSVSPIVGSNTHILVQGNNITNAYRGILMRNQQYQEVRDENNTIKMKAEPNHFATVTTQYGIEHSNVLYGGSGSGYGDDIHQNTINGFFANNFTTPGDFEPKKAIWSNFCSNHYVTCNNVSNAGRGFEFSSTHTKLFWEINAMNTCGEGYALTSNGVIGPQGNGSGASDNQWNNSGFSDTYTDANSLPSASVLYVQTNAPYNPLINASPVGTPYSSFFGTLITTSNASSYNCSPPPMRVVNPTMGNATARTTQHNSVASTNSQLNMLEQIVQDSLPYPTYVAENTFINKNNVFRMIKQDTTLLDSSAILANFYNNNSNSCWALFCTIDDSLNTQNYTYVNSLLNAYNPACNIEQNYKRFYQIYINGLTDTLASSDTTDLETLASSCPMLNGTVVFQARAFHNSLYNSFMHYEDNCPAPENTNNNRTTNVQTVLPANKSAIMIYPNPTNGKVYISGFDANEKTTSIEITDITGKLVYKQQNNIGSGIVELNLPFVSGVYFIRVTNAADISQMQKVIINN